MLSVRLATPADLPAINHIYNHYVPISTTTYDETPMTADERRQWFEGRQAIHPVTVAALPDPSFPAPPAGPAFAVATSSPQLALQSPWRPPASLVVGYGSLHTFRGKRGYRFTVENSVYVHPDHQRQGIGSAILADQIERARALGLRAIVAGIDSQQEASVALHAKHGFIEVARFPQIGHKFGQWLDVIFMQRLLE
jgi:L-amino acid N-acyltransferase YncA